MDHLLAIFPDGSAWLLRDCAADDVVNARLSAAVAAEGRRRLAAGQSDSVVIRARTDADQQVRGDVLAAKGAA